MKKAVIYARYSSDSQNEQSIEGQLRVCNEYAETNDIFIVDTYIDRAMTGTNDNRPDFQRMLHDSKQRKWDFVLVYKLDRFSRDKYESVIHKKTLKNNGVKVLSVMENIPDTPEGIILESLLEGMNQYYSAELAQKVKRGMKETRKKGFFQGGTLPYGYKLDGRKIVVDEDKVEVVRYIYREYANGVYVKDIINNLTKKGILNNNKPFARTTVYKILRNEKYAGIYRYEDEVIEHMYPPIIPQELYEKVKAKSRQNHVGSRSVKTVFLLRHKLVCGYCGNRINGESGYSEYGKINYYYKCKSRKLNCNACKKAIVKKEVFEKFIINELVSAMSDKEIMNEVVKNILRVQENFTQLNTTLQMLIKEQNKAKLALDNLILAVKQGVINRTTNQCIIDLENQIDDLEKQIAIEQGKSTKKITEEQIREFYKDALKLEPRLLIEYLLDKVIVYDDMIEVKFNTPTKSPSDEGFFICTKFAECKSLLYRNYTSIKDTIKVNFYI